MKKALLWLVSISIILTTIFVPVSAVAVNENVAIGQTVTITNSSNNAVNFSGCGGTQAVDGNDNTISLITGISDFSTGYNFHGSTLMVVELDKAYPITKIEAVPAALADVQSALSALNYDVVNFTTNQLNGAAHIYVSNEALTLNNITTAGKNLSQYNSLGTQSVFNLDGETEYKYVAVYAPSATYPCALKELRIWADVEKEETPIAMHFSKTEALTGEAETEFGIGQLYYNGRLVNDTEEEKSYTSFIVSYKDDILEYVDVEKVTVEANGYKDVSIPVYQKIGMDKIRGYMWEDNFAPLGTSSEVTKKDNGYDPLFDGTILTMNPQTYDAKTLIEEYNKTAETPLAFTGISEFENVDTIFFDGIKYKGETKKAFAYVAIPEGASEDNPVPGVVLVHGGGGTAYDRWAKAWADKGYAAISIDTEGRINTKTNTYSNSGRTFSGMGHQNNVSYNDFTADETKHSDMWFYQAASDAILAANVLRNLPEVDASKIGITGISYGSMITMTAIGADNRFSFAAPVYGCGYGWEAPTYWRKLMTNERKAWDPIMFLKQTGDMPILWFATNRDCNFALEELSKTYTDEDVFNKANLVILDNYSHSEELGSIIDTTLDASKYYLNAERQQQMTDAMIEFAKVAFGQEAKGLSKVSRLNYANGKITATVTLPDGVSAEGGKAIFRYVTVEDYDNLYMDNPSGGTSTWWLLKADGTVGTENSYNSPWPKLDATADGTSITVDVPSNATYGFIDYIDSRNILTSSEMIKIK